MGSLWLWKDTVNDSQLDELELLDRDGRQPARAACIFGSEVRTEVVDAVVDALRSAGIDAQRPQDSQGWLIVALSEKKLALAAAEVKMRKRDVHGSIQDFTTESFNCANVPLRSIFSAAEELLLLENVLYDIPSNAAVDKLLLGGEDRNADPLVETCFKQGLLTDIVPFRDDLQVQVILSELSLKLPVPSFATLNRINRYLGDQATLYIAFSSFYVMWLQVLALSGAASLVLTLLNTVPYQAWFLSAYSIFTVLWASRFMDIWRRKNLEYGYVWNNIVTENPLDARHMCAAGKTDRRPQHTERRSHIQKRSLEFAIWTVVATYLLITCSFLYLSLEIAIYTEPYLAKLPKPLFAADSTEQAVETLKSLSHYHITKHCPTLVYIGALTFFELIYKHLIRVLTTLESHKTRSKHENILFLRMMLFNLLNKNMSYFYLAFYKQHFAALKQGLVLINLFDNLGLVAKQALVWGKIWLENRRKAAATGRKKKNDDIGSDDPDKEYFQLPPASTEAFQYARITSQFAQVTLFAAALPHGALVAFCGNFFQVYTDIHCLLRSYRRPFPRRAASVGSTSHAMIIVCMACIATNLAVIVFTSKFGDHIIGDEIDSLNEFLLVIFVEHIILFARHVMSSRTKLVPKWVKADKLREQYQERYQKSVRALSDIGSSTL
eukprot:Plantae.Rhodophyta-Purpureofilum_apyrenoidigerum.ctg2559.p1 GENE.Plantae.Rhodophyta-Purpureofilum_apyrenoidigerum.ctg2559~~Plantae.Rhodophyta-Purpureofilum_apyrenoidigerum.ctg2559.p1  ORF type:complete len:666 (+),score=94.76 Plantae.Rhodophyta-Purpureofilum_apyrenoidigerum.ctg2559:116-2113(+)